MNTLIIIIAVILLLNLFLMAMFVMVAYNTYKKIDNITKVINSSTKYDDMDNTLKYLCEIEKKLEMIRRRLYGQKD